MVVYYGYPKTILCVNVAAARGYVRCEQAVRSYSISGMDVSNERSLGVRAFTNGIVRDGYCVVAAARGADFASCLSYLLY